ETLASLAARKEALLADTEEERSAAEQRIGQLAEEAEDLRDLIARLAEGPPAAKPAETEVDVAALPPADRDAMQPAIRDFPTVPGSLAMPVRGTVTVPYGGMTGSGEA